MKKLAYASVLFALMTTVASAQAPHSTPAKSRPGRSDYEQHSGRERNSDPLVQAERLRSGDNKIGEIMDVLIDKSGKVTGLIIGVGGFLGMGEKDVAVPFDAVKVTSKDNNKWYLVMNSNKDALKSAKGTKYDRNAMTWMPE